MPLNRFIDHFQQMQHSERDSLKHDHDGVYNREMLQTSLHKSGHHHSELVSTDLTETILIFAVHHMFIFNLIHDK